MVSTYYAVQVTGDKHIVLFLGAGFSAAAGYPTMARFAEAARQQLAILRDHLGPHAPRGLREGAPALFEAGQMWLMLRDLAAERIGTRILDPDNIEDLFAFSDGLPYSRGERVRLRDSWISLEYLSRALATWTWSVYNTAPQPLNVHRAYEHLIKTIDDAGLLDRLRVITTNYDLLWEWLVHHYTSDARCEFDLSADFLYPIRVDDGDRKVERRRRIPALKLHGSVNLFANIEPNSQRIGVVDWLDKTHDYCAVHQTNSLWKLRRQRGDSVVPAIIPPTFNKESRHGWIVECWNEACRWIRHAGGIIFLGYSFPPSDGHMKALFATAMVERQEPPPIVRCLDSSISTIQRYMAYFDMKIDTDACPLPFEADKSREVIQRWAKEL